MLHKNRSNNRNQLKFLLVLPALALFLMSFNTKEIYVEKVNTSQSTSTALDLNDFESTNIEANVSVANTLPKTEKKAASEINNKRETVKDLQSVITKDMTDSDLDALVDSFKKEGVTLKFSKIKRNKNNEIVAIAISAKSKNSNTTFHQNHDMGILPITIAVHENSISIGNGKDTGNRDYIYTHKDGVVTFEKAGKGDNIFVYSIDKDHVKDHEVIEDDDKIIIKSGGKVHELKKGDTSKYNFVLKGAKINSSKNIKADTLYFINKDRKGKNTIVISDDDDGKVFELKGKASKDGRVFIHNDEDKDGTVIVKSSVSTFWTDDKDEKVIIESSGNTLWHNDDDNTIALQTIGKGENKIFISGDNNKALLIIDDKEVTKKEFDNLDTDNIESVNVLKGKAATEKYGDKGKNGVIVVTTKKKKD
jgi:TonB-dependent SusC/RagA subfamily outer membrane receptor